MELKKNYKFWFATGSQDLYGDECLRYGTPDWRRYRRGFIGSLQPES